MCSDVTCVLCNLQISGKAELGVGPCFKSLIVFCLFLADGQLLPTSFFAFSIGIVLIFRLYIFHLYHVYAKYW